MANVVTSASFGQVLLRRWYITFPGLLLTVLLVGVAFTLFPPRYSSNATVVLIYPPVVHGANSLLESVDGLETTAVLLVQRLNDPAMAASFGLPIDGPESFKVKNGSMSSTGKVVESPGPFITVTSESPTPVRSMAIAGYVTDQATENLKDIQASLKVRTKNSITLDSVLPATTPARVWDVPLRATGVAIFLGLGFTAAVVAATDRLARRRQIRALRRLVHSPALETGPLLLDPR